ncbi:MAG: hypothetical protein HY678_02875 [Chloroflexi bacterium]|nr:hypothetical protein [Chloroflexota bacterium]
MSMIEPTENLIESYKIYVTRGLEDEERYEDEAILALITRDVIEERWTELTEAQVQQVAAIDDLLVHKRERVAEVLPNGNSVNRRLWWWFLHEGPQVREQAQEVS